jgi:hypothetical protein
MPYRIAKEGLERGGRIEYDVQLDTLERVESTMADVLKDLGVINSLECSFEEDGGEFLVRQFELQGSNGVETRLLVVSVMDVPQYWAEKWLAT